MCIGSDGERIVAERRLERRYYVVIAVAVSRSHPLSCTEGHLHHHWNGREMTYTVSGGALNSTQSNPIIGTVGVLDNLFVIIVFALFVKIAHKVLTP